MVVTHAVVFRILSPWRTVMMTKRRRSKGAGDDTSFLAGNNVGRLAFSFHDRVDMEPIRYVFSDGEGRPMTSAMETIIATTGIHSRGEQL
jgi:nitroimidazol reductase NimA-like FMN-containing flavoprotein (pyridoxamine 5'-phosphate oxidase superfamily)